MKIKKSYKPFVTTHPHIHTHITEKGTKYRILFKKPSLICFVSNDVRIHCPTVNWVKSVTPFQSLPTTVLGHGHSDFTKSPGGEVRVCEVVKDQNRDGVGQDPTRRDQNQYPGPEGRRDREVRPNGTREVVHQDPNPRGRGRRNRKMDRNVETLRDLI